MAVQPAALLALIPASTPSGLRGLGSERGGAQGEAKGEGMKPVRTTASAAALLAGTALFVFYLFSFSVSGGTPSGDQILMGYGGWHFRGGYSTEARIGLAAGAALMVGGWLLRKGA